MPIEVDAERIRRELETLAQFSDAEAPAVTRIVFTAPDRAARAWLKKLCLEPGLEVREDAVGNTFARWRSTNASQGAIGTGSHIDAIPNSGRYDGTVGVLGGLEAIRALQRAGFKPQCDIELLIFTSEEPTRFGIGCLGSRLLSGNLEEEKAASLRDKQGVSFEEVRSAAGFAGKLDDVQLPENYYRAFVELHIEQGPLLEREKIPIGVVTHIAAPASLRISIEGEGGHAGAVLMRQRRDAFLGACEIALAVEAAALETGAIDTVATTGICQVFPGAVNSIPSRVTLETDIRDIELKRRDAALNAIRARCTNIGTKRGLGVKMETVNADPPATCDAGVIAAIEKSCQANGLRSKRMVSRAYHDSLFMARVTAIGMVFIACRGGVSHRPDEYASVEDIANGARVLADTLADLAG